MSEEHRENMLERLDAMSKIKITDIDPINVAELSKVKIDRELSLGERILSLIEQSGNPYIFKEGDIVVKVSFSESGRTLQSCMEDYVESELMMSRQG